MSRILLTIIATMALCYVSPEIKSRPVNETAVNVDSLVVNKNLDLGQLDYKLVSSDETNNYYAVNFLKLNTLFRKKYFMELVYASLKLVSLSSDLNANSAWFNANKIYPVAEMNQLILDLLAQTYSADSTFTEVEKTNWLNTHNK